MTESEVIEKLNADPDELIGFPAEWNVDYETVAKLTGRTIERVSTFDGFNEPGQDTPPEMVYFRPKTDGLK